MNANLTVSTSAHLPVASFAAFRLAGAVEHAGRSAFDMAPADCPTAGSSGTSTNSMLHDIGLFRGDIEFEINKPFWRGMKPAADRPVAAEPLAPKAHRGRTMIDLYYCPTPNGLKMTMFLEEAELPYRIIPVGSARASSSGRSSWRSRRTTRFRRWSTTIRPSGGAPVSLFEIRRHAALPRGEDGAIHSNRSPGPR